MLDAALLERARDVVSRHLPPTPLIPYPRAGLDVPVYLKYEGAQPIGAFKVRGALAALTAYAGERVVTASAGNHALGIAHGARLLSATATVVVPKTAAAVKVEALRRYPVELVQAGDDFDGAERHALALDGRYVSAYSDPHVIAGQSTVVTEVAQALDEPFTIVVPAGAGGLLSGVALGARHADIRVVGVEALACRALSTAVAAGRVVPVAMGETIADGLAGNLAADALTPGIVRECGVRLVAVAEAAIRRSVREFVTSAGLVAEGASATSLAALREGLVPLDRPVVLVVSGRNIDLGLLTTILGER
ncbi:pyridoxal-phosphate dependent enzyme [Amycolatopsis sp. OK19-0408]|uniref:Pyridoxal-phosphate dependent enzyme n=1 Tax=Amycolatopsis iheyensis TaxID=2945988 RepID=A0A9X2N9H8_9PSEU|nr:pyridoxal-phosphate dependent enzyme [Amycolatopsis iheyensis]MCR6483066.1 pyridoxal-phosphate dependent enzyme [Amycolatopsis iheyensis]